MLSCLFLIVVVLLQTGKGADMGAVFGGGSQTLFGSSGAGNFLTHLTTATAIIFMLTSLILTYGQTPGSLPPARATAAPRRAGTGADRGSRCRGRYTSATAPGRGSAGGHAACGAGARSDTAGRHRRAGGRQRARSRRHGTRTDAGSRDEVARRLDSVWGLC